MLAGKNYKGIKRGKGSAFSIAWCTKGFVSSIKGCKDHDEERALDAPNKSIIDIQNS